MRRTVHKIRPTKGYSHLVHTILNLLYVAFLLVLVRLDFKLLAFGLVLLSKWRILAVKPRHWIAHIRVNIVDIIVGFSILSYVFGTTTSSSQVIWAVVYSIWLIFLKPRSDVLSVSFQALFSQTITLCALFRNFTSINDALFIIFTWILTYAACSHFLTVYEEQDTRLLSHIWALFCAVCVWILSHWLIFYGPVPMVAVIIGVLSYTLAGMYALNSYELLTANLKRQFVLVSFALIMVVLVFSEWQSVQF